MLIIYVVKLKQKTSNLIANSNDYLIHHQFNDQDKDKNIHSCKISLTSLENNNYDVNEASSFLFQNNEQNSHNFEAKNFLGIKTSIIRSPSSNKTNGFKAISSRKNNETNSLAIQNPYKNISKANVSLY